MDDGSLCNTVGAALQAGTMNIPVEGKKVQFPTKILCFLNLTKGIILDDDEEYKNFYDDIKEECNKYGRTITLTIPRKDVDDNPMPGFGNVYAEFYSIEEAKEARRVIYYIYKFQQLVNRKYNFKTVRIVYYSEEKYAKRDFN